ncbi:hypothetical protein SAMN03159444_01940 [Pseudomonas sp. NFACC02]|uniref:hypothetical protein n=1 Tax=Pseudomonas sp. NFACC02 TaxID=1566250 RepID=UPI0008D6DDDA|nr:hypothetical protein [Pseudomonas sp. NFACC02]SEQ55752.1 hypothetical protein SAMN03159444_01940 [Pseudomonas sp. NFACC02]
MNKPLYQTPQQICEAFLNKEKQTNTDRKILPSETAIIDRMLTRHLELNETYAELHDVLHSLPYALETFLGVVLTTAAFWNPEKNNQARDGRRKLSEINRQISIRALELAGLLSQRSELHDFSGFTSDTHYHVLDVIEEASEHNGHFQSYVRDDLVRLRYEYDLKYWPSLGDCLEEISENAAQAVSTASSPLTAAATEAIRPSLADFFKALFAAIAENSTRRGGRLPSNLKISDNGLAALANCSLDLSDDDMVDGPYVKRLRQRQREKAK